MISKLPYAEHVGEVRGLVERGLEEAGVIRARLGVVREGLEEDAAGSHGLFEHRDGGLVRAWDESCETRGCVMRACKRTRRMVMPAPGETTLAKMPVATPGVSRDDG